MGLEMHATAPPGAMLLEIYSNRACALFLYCPARKHRDEAARARAGQPPQYVTARGQPGGAQPQRINQTAPAPAKPPPPPPETPIGPPEALTRSKQMRGGNKELPTGNPERLTGNKEMPAGPPELPAGPPELPAGPPEMPAGDSETLHIAGNGLFGRRLTPARLARGPWLWPPGKRAPPQTSHRTAARWPPPGYTRSRRKPAAARGRPRARRCPARG